MSSEPCKELAWDSEFFGMRIARYNGDELTDSSATAALAFCRERRIDCLYLLLSDATVATSRGFHHVDTRLTLACDLRRAVIPAREHSCRVSSPSDIPILREIARISHRDSRFYSDSNFDRSRCDALYETWIERSCEGWADRTLVADYEGRPEGYITCSLSNSGVGSIGLFAVAEAARGKGIGTDLITASLTYFRDSGMHSVEVVTQLRNTAGQHVYQRCGFVPASRLFWFHAWLKPETHSLQRSTGEGKNGHV